MSAIRSAFEQGSPPFVTAAACKVIIAYISTRNILTDSKMIGKILSLLTTTISKLKSLNFFFKKKNLK